MGPAGQRDHVLKPHLSTMVNPALIKTNEYKIRVITKLPNSEI
jgi:hypothetical protein